MGRKKAFPITVDHNIISKVESNQCYVNCAKDSWLYLKQSKLSIHRLKKLINRYFYFLNLIDAHPYLNKESFNYTAQ